MDTILSEEEVLELVEVSTQPTFHAAHAGLRAVFHKAFLTPKISGSKLDWAEVQPLAQQLLAHGAMLRVIELKEQLILDEISAIGWDGSDVCSQLVMEQVATLDALSWMMELAGHRTLRYDISDVPDDGYSVMAVVRVFRAFDGVYRQVLMVRDQYRLQESTRDDEKKDQVH